MDTRKNENNYVLPIFDQIYFDFLLIIQKMIPLILDILYWILILALSKHDTIFKIFQLFELFIVDCSFRLFFTYVIQLVFLSKNT